MPQPHHADRLLSITELAAELGTTPRAVRFYESKGLLEPQRAGGNRIYTYRDRARLLLILRGKRLGFSLAEVKEYLDLYDSDPSKKEQMVHLLRGARQRIGELEEQRRDLELTLAELRDVERQCIEAMAAAGIADVAAAAPQGRSHAARARRNGAGVAADSSTEPSQRASAARRETDSADEPGGPTP